MGGSLAAHGVQRPVRACMCVRACMMYPYFLSTVYIFEFFCDVSAGLWMKQTQQAYFGYISFLSCLPLTSPVMSRVAGDLLLAILFRYRCLCVQYLFCEPRSPSCCFAGMAIASTCKERKTLCQG